MEQSDFDTRILDKLGVKRGMQVAFVELGERLDPALHAAVIERTGPVPSAQDPRDLVIAAINDTVDASTVLTEWKGRIKPAGAIWLLTPKRGRPGYIQQEALIPAGARAGLVDTKICSVSNSVSAMRFVIRVGDRRQSMEST